MIFLKDVVATFLLFLEDVNLFKCQNKIVKINGFCTVEIAKYH